VTGEASQVLSVGWQKRKMTTEFFIPTRVFMFFFQNVQQQKQFCSLLHICVNRHSEFVTAGDKFQQELCFSRVSSD
jgi:hypothetical protein